MSGAISVRGLGGSTICITNTVRPSGRCIRLIEQRNGLSPMAYVSERNPLVSFSRNAITGPSLWIDGLVIGLPEASAVAVADFLGITFT